MEPGIVKTIYCLALLALIAVCYHQRRVISLAALTASLIYIHTCHRSAVQFQSVTDKYR